jgi:hypothetical protein
MCSLRNNGDTTESPATTAGGWLCIEGDLFCDPILILDLGLKYTGKELAKVHDM